MRERQTGREAEKGRGGELFMGFRTPKHSITPNSIMARANERGSSTP